MNKKLTLIICAGIITGAAYLLDTSEDHHSHHHGHDHHQRDEIKISSSALKKNYDLTAQKIEQWSQNNEQDREQLIEITLEEGEIIEDPHSAEALLAQKKGALKVLAFKKVMTAELEVSEKERILKRIISQSRDQTMAKIAKAYLDSLRQGRSFFEDFKVAIGDLPIPE